MPDLKTSFSRSNPVPRGQATVIRCSIRDLFAHACSDLAVRASRERQTIGDGLSPYLSSGQQQNIQSDKLPSYLQSLTSLRPARPSKGSSGKGSDMGRTHTWKPPDQSSLHNFTRTGTGHFARCKPIFLQRIFPTPNLATNTGRKAVGHR